MNNIQSCRKAQLLIRKLWLHIFKCECNPNEIPLTLVLKNRLYAMYLYFLSWGVYSLKQND